MKRWHLRDVIATSGAVPDVVRVTVVGPDHVARVTWPDVAGGEWWALTEYDGTVLACGLTLLGDADDTMSDVRSALIKLGLGREAFAC